MATADKILLLIVPLLALWIVGAMFKSQIQGRFQWFLAYVVSLIGIGVLRFSAASNYRVYFWVFWITEAIYAVLALLALHEVFRQVFLGFYLQYRGFRLLFPCVIAGTLLITGWVALYNPPFQASRLISFVLLLGISVSLMQLCLFGLFIFLARSFNLPWRFAPLGITLGFAISALGTSVAYWMVSVFGTKLQKFGKYAPPVAYILATVVWLDTFLRPEPEPEWRLAVTVREMMEGIRRETGIFRRMKDKLK
jgi:hypothetical protein